MPIQYTYACACWQHRAEVQIHAGNKAMLVQCAVDLLLTFCCTLWHQLYANLQLVQLGHDSLQHGLMSGRCLHACAQTYEHVRQGWQETQDKGARG